MPRWLLRSTFALLVVLVVTACSGGSGNANGTTQANPAGDKIDGVTIEPSAGRSHRHGAIDYSGKKPPSSGDHNPVPLTCGFYAQQPPDEYAVHSLEHGAAWVAYAPSTSAADVAALRALASHPKVIVSPHDGLDAPVVLVAWERRLEVPSASDPRVQQFVDAFAGGSQAPEPGAECVGVGQPAAP